MTVKNIKKKDTEKTERKKRERKRDLTDREKVAIIAFVADSTITFEDAYKISRDTSYKEIKDKDKRAVANNWWRQQRIMNFVKNQQIKFNAIIEEKAKELLKNEKWRKSQIGEINEKTGNLDFTDRNTFINFLSDQVNSLDDEDPLKKDYLKMISDNLQFKTNAFDKNEDDIQRFYTPLHCRECKLYQKQKNQEPKE
jgi:hypothetical protein